MKKLLVIALAIILPLSISAGVSFAEKNQPKPDPLVNEMNDMNEWKSGNSHSWHFNYANGNSGRLNCKIDDDGSLTGVFNGKVSDIEWYCLKVGELIVGYGKANKAGKLHFEVKGEGNDIYWGDNGPDPDDLSLVQFD